LGGGLFSITLETMEVHFAPELQAKIDQLVMDTGRPADKLLEDAMAGYVAELLETREMLNQRYDDLKSGEVEAIDGEAFFEKLREREDELFNL
jgi:predicted transcriptional regulator